MSDPAKKPITRKISGRTFTVDVPVHWDEEADDYLVTSDDLGAADLSMAAALALEGPVDSQSLRFMRAAIGLEQRRLAELLGVRPETVSRWENDVTSVDRAAWLVVAALVLERAGRQVPTLERLERLASGTVPQAEVRIPLG